MWAKLGRQHETVALFGAGRYARWLLETVIDRTARPRVVCIFDDSANTGTKIAGLPVLRPGADSRQGISAVVIATDDPSSPLIARVADACTGLCRVNLYERIDTGPFPTESWLEPPSRTSVA